MQLQDTDFENLLSDIYTAFAPHKISNVETIVEKYKNTSKDQINAIQMALIKYVNPSNSEFIKYSHILPEVGTEKNIIFLMESYSTGERMISEESVIQAKNKIQQEQKEAEQKLLEENETKEKERLLAIQKANDKTNEVNEKLKQELEKFRKDKEELLKQEPEKKSVFEEMEIEIIGFEEPVSKNNDGTIKYKTSDVNFINLPPNKFIATLCIGQRFMTTNKDGFIVGIEVVSIVDDYTEDVNKPVRMISIRKT